MSILFPAHENAVVRTQRLIDYSLAAGLTAWAVIVSVEFGQDIDHPFDPPTLIYTMTIPLMFAWRNPWASLVFSFLALPCTCGLNVICDIGSSSTLHESENWTWGLMVYLWFRTAFLFALKANRRESSGAT